MAGKGDKWRKTNFKKYFENWELIQKDKDQIHFKKIVKINSGKTRFIYK